MALEVLLNINGILVTGLITALPPDRTGSIAI